VVEEMGEAGSGSADRQSAQLEYGRIWILLHYLGFSGLKL
jgi:hypothetical protein